APSLSRRRPSGDTPRRTALPVPTRLSPARLWPAAPSPTQLPARPSGGAGTTPTRGARRGTARRRRTRATTWCPQCPAGGGGRQRRSCLQQRPDGRSKRNVARTEAHRLVVGVDAAVHVVRRPAALVLEQADRADGAVGAQVEPVPRVRRHADQVAGLHLDGEHRAAP